MIEPTYHPSPSPGFWEFSKENLRALGRWGVGTNAETVFIYI